MSDLSNNGEDELSDAQMEADLASFAAHLDQYAATLDLRDRRLLELVLYRALSPLEQLRLRDAAGLLDEEERAILAELKDAGP
ncbi:MAG: hypothetical protein ACRDZ8_08630 [Acidimicrobiales bacterium]